MVYLKFLCKAILKEPMLWIVSVLLCLSCTVCLIVPFDIFGPALIQSTAQQNVSSLSASLSQMGDAPEELKQLHQELFLKTEQVANATSAKEIYYHELNRIKVEQKMLRAGYITGSQNEIEVSLKEFEALTSLDDVPTYNTTQDLPMLEFLTVLPNATPALILFMPAMLILYFMATLSRSQRLLGNEALHPLKALGFRLIIGMLLIFGMLLVIFVPSAVGSLIKHGVGNSLYPIVYLHGGKIIVSNVAECLTNTYSLIILGNIFLFCLGLMIFTFCKQSLLCVVVPVIILLLPLSPWYFNQNSPLFWLTNYLPSSYFMPSQTGGYVGMFYYVDQMPYLQLQAQTGKMIFTIGVCLTLAVSALFGLVALNNPRSMKNNNKKSRNVPLLTITNLLLAYKNQIILKDVSLREMVGQTLGLLAPNGSGKSTLLKALAGDTHVAKCGTICVCGIMPQDKYSYAQNVYLSSEGTQKLYRRMSCKDHLMLVKYIWQSSIEVKQISQETLISEFTDKNFGTLSDGMKQQLQIALARLSNAPLTLLDEPFNALDPNKVKIIEEQIKKMRQEQRLVIIAAHQPEELDVICNKFLLVRDKKLIERGMEFPARELFKREYADKEF